MILSEKYLLQGRVLQMYNDSLSNVAIIQRSGAEVPKTTSGDGSTSWKKAKVSLASQFQVDQGLLPRMTTLLSS